MIKIPFGCVMEPSQDDAARRARWPEKLAVGRVVKAHGVRGDVVIEAWGELGAYLRPETELWLDGKLRRLVNLRGSESRPIGTFEDCTDRDLAENLRGKVLEVRSSVLSTPKDSDLYLFELQNCAVSVVVSAKDGHTLEPRSLGTVRRVVEDGGGLLLEVTEDSPDGTSPVFLVPFVKAYLRTQDLNAGHLVFDLPEGLLETCVSTS